MTDQDPNQSTPAAPLQRQRIQTGAFAQIMAAKDMLGDKYWLFVGICLLGSVIANTVTFILLGPMLVGIYYCYRKLERGQPVEFAMLFKGFERFSQAIIPNLVLFAITLVFAIPFMISYFMLIFSMAENPEPGPALVFFLGGLLLMMLGTFVTYYLFFFTFHLVLDRNLEGMEAIKEGIRASRENTGSVLLALIVFFFASMLGAMACYIGLIFLLPLIFGAHWRIYREVYPDIGLELPGEKSEPVVEGWSSTPE